MSNTTNLDLERPDKGDTEWHTSLNSNMYKIDTGYGNNVSTIADLPQMYIETGTFNYTTGDVITLPVTVDATNEYGVEITPTSWGSAIGDIYVTKTTSQFTVHCSSDNTADTFEAVIYYIGDIASYGGSIYRRWYVSPDAGIADHGNAATVGSFAWVLDQIGGTLATVELPGNKTYTITTATEVPDNVNIIPQKGAIFDGAGTLHINGVFDPGEFQVFGDSITVTFGFVGTTEIHPEWWGEYPNGATSDVPVLNKAIAASDTVGDFNEYVKAEIHTKPGRYLIEDGAMSDIKCSFIAPGAVFTAVDNIVTASHLFRFDYSEITSFRQIDIGSIYGKDVLDDTPHFNYGLEIVGGDSARVRIGGLYGLYMGVCSLGTDENHVGMWDVEIDTIMGCDYGIYARSGTEADTQFEANQFRIRYITYCDTAIALETDHSVDSDTIGSNMFEVGHLELHARANMIGLNVSGVNTFSNVFRITGALSPPSGTGYIVSISNDAYDNLFDLCYVGDWTYINPSGGYNIWHETWNQNTVIPSLAITNDYGRSEIRRAAAPATGPWRVGDICWNSTPSAGGALGWVCTTAGTPGTWKAMANLEA